MNFKPVHPPTEEHRNDIVATPTPAIGVPDIAADVPQEMIDGTITAATPAIGVPELTNTTTDSSQESKRETPYNNEEQVRSKKAGASS
jgi:hypothetical protein